MYTAVCGRQHPRGVEERDPSDNTTDDTSGHCCAVRLDPLCPYPTPPHPKWKENSCYINCGELVHT